MPTSPVTSEPDKLPGPPSISLSSASSSSSAAAAPVVAQAALKQHDRALSPSPRILSSSEATSSKKKSSVNWLGVALALLFLSGAALGLAALLGASNLSQINDFIVQNIKEEGWRIFIVSAFAFIGTSILLMSCLKEEPHI